MDMGRGEERVRCMERVTWKLTLPYVKWIANGNLLYGSGTQTGALYQPRGVKWGGIWEGGSKGRGDMYTYDWLMLRFDKKQENSVKKLSFKKKIKKVVVYKIHYNAPYELRKDIPLNQSDNTECTCRTSITWPVLKVPILPKPMPRELGRQLSARWRSLRRRDSACMVWFADEPSGHF